MKPYFLILLLAPLGGTYAQTLDNYLTEAAENNPGLKARYSQFEASLQRVAQARQLPAPTLQFGYFIRPVETRVGPQQARIGLVQMFPWFGTLRAKGDAAAHAAEARYYEFVNAREQLFLEVRTLCYRLMENRELVPVEEENLRVLRSLHTLSLTRYENGKGSLADVYRVENLLDEGETALHLLRVKDSTLEVQFNKLLNRDETLPVPTPNEFPAADNLPPAPGGGALHPSRRALSEMRESALAAERAAVKASYPTLGIGADYVFIGSRTDMDVPGSGQDALMPMVSLTIPIFRKGYKAAQVEAQKMAETYEMQSAELENSLGAQQAQASYSLTEAGRDELLLRRQINKSQTIVEVLLSGYTGNTIAFEELLREQRKTLGYQRTLIHVQADKRIAIARLTYLQSNGQ